MAVRIGEKEFWLNMLSMLVNYINIQVAESLIANDPLAPENQLAEGVRNQMFGSVVKRASGLANSGVFLNPLTRSGGHNLPLAPASPSTPPQSDLPLIPIADQTKEIPRRSKLAQQQYQPQDFSDTDSDTDDEDEEFHDPSTQGSSSSSSIPLEDQGGRSSMARSSDGLVGLRQPRERKRDKLKRKVKEKLFASKQEERSNILAGHDQGNSINEIVQINTTERFAGDPEKPDFSDNQEPLRPVEKADLVTDPSLSATILVDHEDHFMAGAGAILAPGPATRVKFDYHSTRRLTTGSIICFVKMILIVGILNMFDQPAYLYFLPGLFCICGTLTALRAAKLEMLNSKARTQIQSTDVELQIVDSV